MQPDEPSRNKKWTGPPKYFLIAAACLLAMGASWSIDASIVYIFLGAACYFLFLGFYNRPRRDDNRPSREKPKRESLASRLRKTSPRPAETTVLKSLTADRIRKIALLSMFLFFGLVVTFVIVILVASDNSAPGVGQYVELGAQYFYEGQYDSAYSNYRRALRLESENQTAAVGLGNTLMAMGRLDSAAQVFDRVLATHPDNSEASYGKALIALNRERYSDGIDILRPVLTRQPEFHDALLLMGDLYYVQNRYDEAIPWYERAFAHEDQRTQILCHVMAYIYDTKGDYPKAIRFYREALQYDSSVTDIYRRLGELIPGKEGDFFRLRAAQ